MVMTQSPASFVLLALMLGGGWIRADAAPPWIVRQPESVAETIGGAAGFVVDATDGYAGPLRYQWFHDGTAMPGQTRRALSLAPLAAGQGGTYVVRVANEEGFVSSSAAQLSLRPEPVSPVDPTFRTAAVLSATPHVVCALRDGGVIAADNATGVLHRVLANGSPNPTWTNPAFTGDVGTHVRAVVEQPDGRILVAGRFAVWAGRPVPFPFVRLNSEGTLDEGFSIDPAIRGNLPDLIAVQPDGRIVVADAFNAAISAPVRLRPTGQVDLSFAAPAHPPIDLGYGEAAS